MHACVRVCVCVQVPCNHAMVPHGYVYKTPGSCELTKCQAPPRGMYYTESCTFDCDACHVDNCTNRHNATTYHGLRFTNVSDQCPLETCTELPPP